jgi:hypothetical protein
MKAMQKELGDKDTREGATIWRSCRSCSPSKVAHRGGAQRAERELQAPAQMNPMSAEATVVRNYLDWLLAVPWTEESHQEPRPGQGGQGARRGPLRARGGQGAHPRAPRGERAVAGDARADPVPRRSARASARPRSPAPSPGPRPPVRAHRARRRARRGGDPGPPAHLHRRDARPAHAGDEAGGHHRPGAAARRGRQDVVRHPRRPGRLRCSRCSTPSRTARSTTTTSTWTTTCRR